MQLHEKSFTIHAQIQTVLLIHDRNIEQHKNNMLLLMETISDMLFAYIHPQSHQQYQRQAQTITTNTGQSTSKPNPSIELIYGIIHHKLQFADKMTTSPYCNCTTINCNLLIHWMIYNDNKYHTTTFQITGLATVSLWGLWSEY